MATETVLKNFERWKEFLGERVEQAKKTGMSEETIANLAVQIGEFLSDKVDPENKEERLLKELWDAADDQERKTLARLVVKLVSKS
jgi:nuclear transport factor 2 (NTF2) superfamily protein